VVNTKTLPQLALPLVISFTTRFLFALVDMAFAAVFVGIPAVAAIAFYAPFQAIYIALWVGLSGGFTASLAAAFGHEDEARVRELKGGMRRILATIVPVLALAGAAHWFAVPAYGLDPALEEQFQIYATTLLSGMALTGFWAMYPDSIVKAHHDTRSTMIAGLIASFSNIALNTLFVLGLGMGIFGIALGTVLSRLGSLAYASQRARRLEAARQAVPWTPISRSWGRPVASILTLAVPGALTFVLMALEGTVINAGLASLPDAVSSIASWGVYWRMVEFGLMPAAGCAVAVVPYAARLLPQGRIAQVRRDLLRTMAGLAGVGVLVGFAVGWAWPGPVARFFLRGDDGVPPAALDALRFLPLAVVGAIPFYLYRPLFEAAQQPRVGIALSGLRFLGLSVPLLVLGYTLGPAMGWNSLTSAVVAVLVATMLTSCVSWWAAHRLLRQREAAAH